MFDHSSQFFKIATPQLTNHHRSRLSSDKGAEFPYEIVDEDINLRRFESGPSFPCSNSTLLPYFPKMENAKPFIKTGLQFSIFHISGPIKIDGITRADTIDLWPVFRSRFPCNFVDMQKGNIIRHIFYIFRHFYRLH